MSGFDLPPCRGNLTGWGPATCVHLPGAMDYRQNSSLPPNPQHKGEAKGQDLFTSTLQPGEWQPQWSWRVQAGSELMSTNTQTHQMRQGSGSVTLSILLPPTDICPVEEPNREAATSHALNHSHHRNRSEIHACLLPRLLSSGKMTKSHRPSFNSEVRC